MPGTDRNKVGGGAVGTGIFFMNNMILNGQDSVATSAVKVYVVTNRTSYSVNLQDFDFSSKEKADQFIQLMQSEGYEITQFAGEGYIG